jgi:para-nitrobenzyl esterase
MKRIQMVTMAAAALMWLHAALPAQTVKVESGVLVGTTGKNAAVRVYRGIPYAAPPVGKLRWAPPVQPAHWQGVRQASEYGARCMQNPVYGDMLFRDKGMSEDCLFLNVWTPASANANLPVLFWLHGGGYEAGSGDEPRYDGESFAAQGIVVVSINYRLGVFGYFAHPDLAAESAHHATGNYGLLDMVAALQWVHRNIAAFGGNPAHVTIGGESAGSMAVSALMASPLTKGLFSAAIGESGAVFTPKPTTYFRTVPAEVAASRSLDYQKAAKASSLAELRAMPAEQLLKTAYRGIVSARDGYFFDRDPKDVYLAGDQAHVPVLIGWNSEEAKGGIRQKPTVESFRNLLQQLFQDDTTEALRYFPDAGDEDAYASMLALQNDLFTVHPSWLWAEYQIRSGHAPVYRYLFSRAVPGAPGAIHASEIEYVFSTLDSKPNVTWTDGDRQLSETMNHYWANFIRSYNPNAGALPQWTPFNEGKVQQLDLTIQARTESGRKSQQYLEFYGVSH